MIYGILYYTGGFLTLSLAIFYWFTLYNSVYGKSKNYNEKPSKSDYEE